MKQSAISPENQMTNEAALKRLKEYTVIFEEKIENKPNKDFSDKEKEMYIYLGIFTTAINAGNLNSLEEIADPFISPSDSGAEEKINPLEETSLTNEMHTLNMKRAKDDLEHAKVTAKAARTHKEAAKDKAFAVKKENEVVTDYLANPKKHIKALTFLKKEKELVEIKKGTEETRKDTERLRAETAVIAVANELATDKIYRAMLYSNYKVNETARLLKKNPQALALELINEFEQTSKISVLKIAHTRPATAVAK